MPDRKEALLTLGLIALAISGATAGMAGQASPKQSSTAGTTQQMPGLIRSVAGPDLFRAYCATCHGVDGKGDGPAAAALKTKPANLTVLAMNHHGQFPAAEVRSTITGENVLASHGSREMPIWGPIFHQVEADVDRGNVRLENLLKYLESIQIVEKPAGKPKAAQN